MLFEARSRSSFDFVTLLNDILPCVQSSTASPQHRVGAAVVALKVASDVGPSAILDTIYWEIEPFLKTEQIDPVAGLEAEIIYQTMRGTQDLDVELLERFSLTARSLHGEVAYSHALIACSSSCRVAGRDADAARFIHAAFEHAVSHKLGARVAVVLLSTVRLHVAAANWVAARAALSTLQQYPLADEDKNTRAEWNFFDGRVALEEGDLRRADAAVSKLEIVPQWHSAGRNAACLALTLRVKLALGCEVDVINSLVRDLESTHRINRDIANQDFEAYALFLGLVALGEKRRGLDLLKEYVHEYRGTRRPLSNDIREVVRPHEGDSKNGVRRPPSLNSDRTI